MRRGKGPIFFFSRSIDHSPPLAKIPSKMVQNWGLGARSAAGFLRFLPGFPRFSAPTSRKGFAQNWPKIDHFEG
jgi:hypothetical protein